jgi:hypothetical protein
MIKEIMIQMKKLEEEADRLLLNYMKLKRFLQKQFGGMMSHSLIHILHSQ